MTGAKVLLAAGLAAGVAAVLALPDVAGDRGGGATPAPARGRALIFASLPAGCDPLQGGRLPSGSRLLRLEPDGPGPRSPAPLAPLLAAAGHPHVSFDGETVLFAGREKEGDADAIFEMRVDGGGLRRLAGLEGGDCSRPVRLPDGRVAFAGPAPGFRGGRGAAVRALWTVEKDGTGARRITFHASGEDGDPVVLNDGRILFTHREGGASTLLAVHVDGTFVHAVHGQRLPAADRRLPREGEDRSLLLVEGGEARRIDPRRPDRASAPLLPGLEGTVAAVEPLPGGGFVLSHRAGAGRPTFGLLLVTAAGPPAGTPLFDDPDREEVDPAAVAVRRRPQGHLTTVDAAKERGELFCIDARRLDGPSTVRGHPSVAAVRIFEGLPPGEPGVEAGESERLLGTLPLAPDGSFYAAFPPDRPLRIEGLAADGAVVAASGMDFWVRPGEVRGCIGCHEDPAVAPPNVFPGAVERAPVDLGAPERAWRPR